MTKAERIEQFIRENFERYSLVYGQHFNEYSLEDETSVELPLAVGDKLNMELVERAAVILGARVDALLNLDGSSVGRWFKKYSYFGHRHKLEQAYARTYLSDDIDILKLNKAIFDEEFTAKQALRFDYSSVKERLESLIIELDKTVPGTYHSNAKITQLKIDTSNFCHYSGMKEMISSYVEMFNRVKELFYKAWDNDLTIDEIDEYNILVSAIGIEDMVRPSNEFLYYDTLCKCRKLYKQEGYSEFSDYVRVNHWKSFRPWRCAEFVDDKQLVEKYAEILPNAKSMMREFSQKVSKFECEFVWSDALPIRHSIEEEAELDEFLESIGEKNIPYEERALEHTTVYVKKTSEEMNGDEYYAEKLKRLSGTVKQGGIPIPENKVALRFDVSRMNARIKLMGGTHHA